MSLVSRAGVLRKTTPLCILLAASACGGDGRPMPAPTAPTQTADRALLGVVVESGTRAGVPGATVCVWQQTGGDAHGTNCAQTGQDGSYRIVFTSPVVGNCPYVYGEAFEIRQDCVPLTNPNTTWSPSVQRVVRIAAGRTISSTVFPDDVGGLQQEDYCVGCKRIRILPTREGKLTAHLTDGAGLRLEFNYSDMLPGEPYLVKAGQEITAVVKNVGRGANASFELATVFVPD